MNPIILIFGNIFDGLPDSLTGPAEIFIEGNWITKLERSLQGRGCSPSRITVPKEI